MSQHYNTATMLEDKILAAFNELSQRHTRPRKRIADRLVELAISEDNFTIDELWQSLRKLPSSVNSNLGRFANRNTRQINLSENF
jgi:hypothetical protein